MDSLSLEFIWRVARAKDITSVVDAFIDFTKRLLDAEFVEAKLIDGQSFKRGSEKSLFDISEIEIDSLKSPTLKIENVALHLPLFESDTERTLLIPKVSSAIRDIGVRSFAAVGTSLPGESVFFVSYQYHDSYHQFTKQERDTLQWSLRVIQRWFQSPIIKTDEPTEKTSLDSEYSHILRYGELVMVRTDGALNAVHVVGETERIFGVRQNEFIHDPNIWQKLVFKEDLASLVAKLQRGRSQKSVVDTMVRIRHAIDQTERWISVRAVPRFDSSDNFIGWEGIGFDVTEKRRAEERLERSRSRLAALYHVTKGVVPSQTPRQILTKTIHSLSDALLTDGIIALLINPMSGHLEVIASKGVEEKELIAFDKACGTQDFLAELKKNPSLSIKGGELSHLPKSLPRIFANLIFEQDREYGAIVVVQERPLRIEDRDLIQAACRYVALTIRQSEYLVREREDAKRVSVLYRLSSELSRVHSEVEVVESAFKLISEEIPAKRLWLGVMNDQKTHIVGIAGSGQGMKLAVSRSQVELSLRHDYLDEAIKEKSPRVVPAGTPLECSGFNKILKRLRVGTLVIIPLLSFGQVVGVLILEPEDESHQVIHRKLPLLVQMSGEIGTILVSRKLEARITESDKMRMAGVLAAGVAHNFNNLLQAIMGQASLIEMQSNLASPVTRSAKMIMEAASRGASMVTQLLTFSSTDTASFESVDLTQMLHESREFYKSILGKKTSLLVNLEADVPSIRGNSPQLQQALANILVNAKEALVSRENPKVQITSRRVRLNSGEVSPLLAPGQYLQVSIEDNGRGMTAEEEERCFEPFYTTKTPSSGGVHGVGLGLSSAYSIIRAHQGFIQVKSTEGVGTTFDIFLPVTEERTAEPVKQQSDIGIVSMDETFVYSVKTFCSSMGLSCSDEDSNTLESSDTKALIIDGDSAEEVTRRIIRGEIIVKGAVLVATEDLDKWEPTDKVRFFKKPFGAWSVYTALSDIVPNGGKPLRSSIEVTQESK